MDRQRLRWLLGFMVAVSLLTAVAWAVLGWASNHEDDQRPVTSPTASSERASSIPGPTGLTGDTSGSSPSGGSGDGEKRPIGTPDQRDEEIRVGPIQREYLVLRPSWATSQSNLPLVIALHGLMVDRFAMLNAADWRGAVEERGFVAVFPQGFGNSWNVGPCCPPANTLQLDDIGFLDSVIKAVTTEEGADRDRVFMSGFSGGGLMTYRYGCARSDQLAAIGPIAGVNLTGCAPTKALSLYHQHSDPDPVVPFDGSPGIGQIVSSKRLPAVLESIEAWSDALGCTSGSQWERVTDKVDSRSWGDCRDSARVRLVRLDGVGHEWPRTNHYDGLGAMLDFFGIS